MSEEYIDNATASAENFQAALKKEAQAAWDGMRTSFIKEGATEDFLMGIIKEAEEQFDLRKKLQEGYDPDAFNLNGTSPLIDLSHTGTPFIQNRLKPSPFDPTPVPDERVGIDYFRSPVKFPLDDLKNIQERAGKTVMFDDYGQPMLPIAGKGLSEADIPKTSIDFSKPISADMLRKNFSDEEVSKIMKENDWDGSHVMFSNGVPMVKYPDSVKTEAANQTAAPWTFNPLSNQPTPFDPTAGQLQPFSPTSGQTAPFDPTAGKPIPFNPPSSQPVPFDPTAGNPTPFDPTAGKPTPFDPTASKPTPFNPTVPSPSGAEPTNMHAAGGLGGMLLAMLIGQALGLEGPIAWILPILGGLTGYNFLPDLMHTIRPE